MKNESPWAGVGPGRAVAASVVLGALIALGLTIGVVYGLVIGDFVGALLLGGFALYFLILVGSSVALWWRPRRATPSPVLVSDAENTAGVTFRFSGWAYFWSVGSLALNAIAALLIGLLVIDGGGATGAVIAILAFAAAVFLALLVLRLLYGAPGRLRLTPVGLEHHGSGVTHRLAWDSIVDVVPAAVHGSPAILVQPSATAPADVRFAWSARIGGRKGFLLPLMAIRGFWLADDPLVVYHALWHYHVNPEHRVELSSEAAVERIQQGRFLLR